MTNEQIITMAKVKLVADGKIKPEEEIHTYGHWKKLGFQVFRGEKAVACLNVWKFSRDEKKDEDEEEPKQEDKIRMRKAYFFSTNQVFAIEG